MSRVKRYVYYILITLIFLLGIYLRTAVFIEKGVFEDDECRLAISMCMKNIWQMLGPLGPWSASPLFMFVSKIIAHFSHYNEYALQFLPYAFSVASIFVFYKITTEYFERKAVIIFANFLFAINQQFLFFAATFKQYSLEVLICLLCLYYLPKADMLTINKKQMIIMALLLAIMPLLSLPSLFYIGVFILMNLYRHRKSLKELIKRLLLILSPLLTVMIPYYIFNLAPTKALQIQFYNDYWQSFYSSNLLTEIANHLRYVFYPNVYILCFLILLICSCITIILEKNKNKQLGIYMILTYAAVLLMSVLKLYPYMDRMALHVVPILLLLMLKPIDLLSTKKLPFYLVLFMSFIGFMEYFKIGYIYDVSQGFVGYAPDSLMELIVKDFSPKTDKIALDEASLSSYFFYARKHKFDDISNLAYIRFETDNVREEIFNSLNNLDKEKNYWFYLVKEFEDGQRKSIIEWVEQQPNIKFAAKIRDSYLYYVIPPFKKISP